MKTKSIMFKTFIFTTALITIISIVSFGTLYAVLPKYYVYLKNRTLNRNTELLVAELAACQSSDDIKALMAKFCTDNNATISSFNKDGEILPELSFPLVMLNEPENTGYTINVILNSDGADLRINETAGLLPSTPTEITDKAKPVPIISRGVFYRRSTFESISIIRELNTEAIGFIDIISTLQPIDEAQRVVVSLLPYLLIFNIAVAIIASFLYSRRITGPIILLSDTAERMRELTPDISSNLNTNDEIGLLSQNLDTLYLRFCATIETLKNEMEKVSYAEKSKTDFMRAASHELKTPLAALNGITEGMIDGIGIYSDKQLYLCESKKLIDRMTLLVEEILSASKLEYLGETISLQDVNITEIVESVLADYAYEISANKLDMHYHCKEFICYTDEKIITSALSNIISNAVRYTVTGGRLEIGISDGTFYVSNQCAAIADDELKRVFEPFYVLSYSRDRTKTGTGIGLFIVKKNLDILGLPFELKNTSWGVSFNINFG